MGLTLVVSALLELSLIIFCTSLLYSSSFRYVVHCFDCSRTISSSLDRFVVLTQYSIEYLTLIYDNFTLTIPDKSPVGLTSTTSIANFAVLASNGLNTPSNGEIAVTDVLSEIFSRAKHFLGYR